MAWTFRTSRIDTYDVQLASGVMRGTVGADATVENGSTSVVVGNRADYVYIPEGTNVRVGNAILKETAFDNAVTGQPVKVLMGSNLTDVRSYSAPVTLGAYCGHPVEEVESLYFKNEDDSEGELVVRTSSFKFPTPNSEIFSEAVTLSYKYDVKAEPISGSCEIKNDLNAEYWRNAGRKKKWTLFGGSKTTFLGQHQAGVRARLGFEVQN